MQLINGDCLKELNMVADNSVSLILCDLPYGTTARNGWDEKIPFAPLWKQFERVITANGVVALWSQMPFSAELVMSNPRMFRYEWIIEKGNATGFLNAKKMPLKAHENVLIFYKSLPTYNPQMTHGHERKSARRANGTRSLNYGEAQKLSVYDSTDRYPRDVLRFSWDKQKSKLHPTQKPVAACEYFIRTYTNPGYTVLDCCMGSGSTGVAALNTERDFIGIELDEEYFKVAEERLNGIARAGVVKGDKNADTAY